jgi:hypothetical protein
MNEAQEIAYLHAQVACAMIEAMGMQAANAQQLDDQPYQKKDFDELIEKYNIHHNGVIGAFFHR